MKRIVIFVLAVCLIFSLLAGCGKKEDPEPEAHPTTLSNETAEPEATTEVIAETPPEPEPEENANPENMSVTTGRTDTTTVYKPVVVQIDNEPSGRPQRGPQLADVVYETLIEGTDTRLTCVFNDAIWSEGAPDEIKVGPVRSSRYYHQWIQGEWDALYVHMGGAENVNNPESDIWGDSAGHIKQRINGAGKKASNANLFYPFRDGRSISEYAAVDLASAVEVYNYEPKAREPFRYYPLEDYTDEKQIDNIELSFLRSSGWVEYRYDGGKDKLMRYMSGDPFVAQETGEAVEVQNLIVQYVPVSTMPNDAGDRKKIDVFGKGPAEFIVHGKHLQGTWERGTNADSTKYYLEDGTEVTLTPGNTWVAMHPNNRAVVINYEDGSDYSVND